MILFSCQLLHLRLRLLQSVRHPHLAVHRRRGGEVLLGLFAFARASVEFAKAEVAVGDETGDLHAKLLRRPAWSLIRTARSHERLDACGVIAKSTGAPPTPRDTSTRGARRRGPTRYGWRP